ncbi:MAG TPA: 23S rRNA (uracil(1939)-C(5))-methyltransferase RlmD [Burkholderiales bacterium]
MAESMLSSPAARSAPRADEATARIESLSHEGAGVAHVDGKATFIDGALPGEHVRFRYRKRRARYDTGAVLEVLEPSPDRVTPPCRYFGVCGGCTLQHLAAPAQLAAKQQILAETLAHVGRVQPERWLPAIAGPDRGYRRRARLGARVVPKKGGVLVGFRERRRSYITSLHECLTLDPRLSALLAPLHALIGGLSRPDRLPQVEVSAGDTVLAAVFRHLEPLTAADRERLAAFAAAHAVAVYLQPHGPDSVEPLAPLPPPELTYALPAFGVTLAFAPTDFIQVNAAVNRALVTRAVELLEPGPNDRIVELFCGLGNFTLPIARGAGSVVAFEGDAGLVERARANAQRNRRDNVQFQVADLYAAPAAGGWAVPSCDKLLLDPPRGGAMEALKALPAEAPGRIVYVSCNPATLARDAEYLVHARGYRLAAAGVADMFPHTNHVESIALFLR